MLHQTALHLSLIHILQAVYVPADDLTDPAPATTFSHLDGTLVLSRQIAELGIYPAVDPLDSTSRILDPNVVGEEHYGVARGVQQVLQKYKEDVYKRQKKAIEELRSQMADEIVQAVEATLKEKLDMKKHVKLIDNALKKVVLN